MKRVRAKLNQLKDSRLASDSVEFLRANKRYLPIAGVMLLFLVVYLFSKFGNDPQKVLLSNHASRFEGGRVLGTPLDSYLKGKDSLLSRRAGTFLAAQKELKGQLKALKDEINALKKTKEPQKADKNDEKMGLKVSNSKLNLIPESVNDKLRISQASPIKRKAKRRRGTTGKDIVNFPVKGKAQLEEEKGIVLPSGAFVKGTIMTGVDAHTQEWPVLIQLDYAFVGPNDYRIDLTGCFIIAKAKGDLSIERAIMQTEKMSCVSKTGEMFERQINGWVNDDKDNRFGVIGPVNSKQDRVMATAFLASIVEGVGKAIQQAQTTQQTTPLGGSQSVITGEQGAYIAGGAASNAAGMVAQWYLKQAQNLLPSITVGSGSTVWVALKDSVNLPNSYFRKPKEGEENAQAYRYLSRVVN